MIYQGGKLAYHPEVFGQPGEAVLNNQTMIYRTTLGVFSCNRPHTVYPYTINDS